MLVLGRSLQEGENVIWIGDDIKVTLCWQKGRMFGIGVEAPPHVKILRGELRERPETPRQASPLSGHVRTPRNPTDTGAA